MQLTPSQKAAIEHPGRNLQIIACAGSGKTEVVARRVVHLLTPGRPDSLSPGNIVAFTFTKKAAAELKDRIIARTKESLGEIPGMADMFVGTIHGFCLDLLQQEVPEYLKYSVLNDVQQFLFIDRSSKKAGLTSSSDLTGKRLRRWVDTPHYLSAINIVREANLNPEKLRDCSVVGGLAKYRDLLRDKRYFDYSSILEEAASQLADNTSLRERLSDRFRYVIVDEYQDVNPVQERIVRSLHDLGARLCVVGDDDQTIYQWRGSDVSQIMNFAQRYPAVDQVRLNENFRSSPGIIGTARSFVETIAARLPKAMQPAGAQATEPGDIAALHFDTPEDEAQHIATTARALRGLSFTEDRTTRGLAWSDMAVLLRSVKRNGEPITTALKQSGIPYIVSGMTNLFHTREAQAARMLFYFMANREGVDETVLEMTWLAADLGLDQDPLREAIGDLGTARAAAHTETTSRWGAYSIQRVFLSFLETAGVRDERVPDGRGDVVFFNLGKFSQVISDYETIHYHSSPSDKYESFANFLEYRAGDAYSEGWQDNQYVTPDAVQIMTVHQAKGKEWPVVFVPALLRNRFPSAGPRGRSAWHLIPETGVVNASRYKGSPDDERRLFYVAMTRSQKFLHMTWAPIPGHSWYQKKSEFWEETLASPHVKRRRPDYTARAQSEPKPKAGVANVVFSFSDLKYFFECPYHFKLRILYGFNAPIHEALGYGKSLHDALAEVHARVIDGNTPAAGDAQGLIDTHLHVPYAYPALKEKLETAAVAVIRSYLADNATEFGNIEFSEKQVEISLGDGITVNGRIDLVRRKDTHEVTIVDLKSSDRAQPEEVTEKQLHTYALGYQELTGDRPNFVEIYELEGRKRKPRSVDEDFMQDVRDDTLAAANALRGGGFPARPSKRKCSKCDYLQMCSAGLAATATSQST